MKNREARRGIDRESEQSVGMQAGEECGFHGNPRKAELWVSVPALHCTGPRLSAALLSPSLSLQLPPLHLFLLPSTPPPHPPYTVPPSRSLHLPPSCDRVTHTHSQPAPYYPHQSQPVLSPYSLETLSYEHIESRSLQPASPSRSPLPAQSPPTSSRLHPPPPPSTHCTSSGLS